MTDSEFWNSTPKKIINQWNVFCEFNGLNDEDNPGKEEKKYIDQIGIF